MDRIIIYRRAYSSYICIENCRGEYNTIYYYMHACMIPICLGTSYQVHSYLFSFFMRESFSSCKHMRNSSFSTAVYFSVTYFCSMQVAALDDDKESSWWMKISTYRPTNNFNWCTPISVLSTKPHLRNKPWWVIKGTASTGGGTPLSIPDLRRVEEVKLSIKLKDCVQSCQLEVEGGGSLVEP